MLKIATEHYTQILFKNNQKNLVFQNQELNVYGAGGVLEKLRIGGKLNTIHRCVH